MSNYELTRPASMITDQLWLTETGDWSHPVETSSISRGSDLKYLRGILAHSLTLFS